jgi:capsular polysaccharide export protein
VVVSVLRTPIGNYGLWRSSLLSVFLERPIKVSLLPLGNSADTDWLGWGVKASATHAAWYARCTGGRTIRLEDGFLRSFGTGEHFPPLSLVVDDVGIYYDSTRSSALEALLASRVDLLEGIAAYVAHAKSLLLKHRLSKYNHAPDWSEMDSCLHGNDEVRAICSRVLVIDQTVGDMSVSLGGASADTFTNMLAAARAENPQATIYVKTHPEVTSGRKGGYLTVRWYCARRSIR